jgi:hypothetical protein
MTELLHITCDNFLNSTFYHRKNSGLIILVHKFHHKNSGLIILEHKFSGLIFRN